jgi:hypothetical protein
VARFAPEKYVSFIHRAQARAGKMQARIAKEKK